MEETEFEEKKKFVLTRGMLILGILILIIIIVLVIVLIKLLGNSDKLSIEDYEKLEQRMIEEAPIYIYQNNIELSEEELKIELKDMLEENGGSISSDKMKAAKECDGYVIATKKEYDMYDAYIKCGSSYKTSGYVSNDNIVTTKKTTTNKDKQKPVITIIGETELTIYVGDSYVEKGAKASDNIDGDITSKIVMNGTVDTSKAGTYIVTYDVSDNSGNKSSKTRTIFVKDKTIIKTTTTTSTKINTTTKNINTTKTTTTKRITTTRPISAPTIILNGSSTIYLEVGNRYIDPGYIASDGTGKNITANVKVSGSVNTNIEGTYILTYSVTDSYGNIAVTNRNVVVKSTSVAVNSITVSPNIFDLLVGETKTISYFITPSNATNKSVSWSSSNASVATVSSSGVVTARKKGTTIITVKTNNGKTATAKVVVK